MNDSCILRRFQPHGQMGSQLLVAPVQALHEIHSTRCFFPIGSQNPVVLAGVCSLASLAWATGRKHPQRLVAEISATIVEAASFLSAVGLWVALWVGLWVGLRAASVAVPVTLIPVAVVLAEVTLTPRREMELWFLAALARDEGPSAFARPPTQPRPAGVRTAQAQVRT